MQLIFRKVADVKREKELAERRKNEPLQELSQDHLVRKIFSKFKRNGSHESRSGAGGGGSSSGGGGSGGGGESRDVEKGPNVEKTEIRANPQSAQSAESSGPKSTTKWTVTQDPADDKENAPADNVQKDVQKTGTRSFSKWSRVLTKEPTIEEESPPKEEDLSADYQKILANLVDLRVDLKLEMQRLNSKICRVDEQIGHLLRLVRPRNEKSAHPVLVLRAPEMQRSKSLSRRDSLPKRRTKDSSVRTMLENEIHEQDKDVISDTEKNK